MVARKLPLYDACEAVVLLKDVILGDDELGVLHSSC